MSWMRGVPGLSSAVPPGAVRWGLRASISELRNDPDPLARAARLLDVAVPVGRLDGVSDTETAIHSHQTNGMVFTGAARANGERIDFDASRFASRNDRNDCEGGQRPEKPASVHRPILA